MTVVVAWTLVGIGVAMAAPRVLRRMVARGCDAVLVFGAWAIAVAVVVIALALPAVAETVHQCWFALHAGRSGEIDTAAGVFSAVVIVVSVVRALWHARRAATDRTRLHARHADLAWLLATDDRGPAGVLWLPTSRPLAYSVAGDPGWIVMTTGLRQRLDRAAITAVLAHERAHLHRRHHGVLAVASTVAAAVPWLPLMRQSPDLVRTLVELDADAHAAHVYGSAGLRRALQVLGAHPVLPAVLGMGGGCLQLRMDRLATMPGSGRAPAGRGGSLAAVWAAAVMLVAAAFTGFIAVASLISCAHG
ncbi:M56 family metallopeptidase [Mycobacterium sp. BMJ-28]